MRRVNPLAALLCFAYRAVAQAPHDDSLYDIQDRVLIREFGFSERLDRAGGVPVLQCNRS